LTEIRSLPPRLHWFSCHDNRLTKVCVLPDSIQSLHLGSNQLCVLPNLPTRLHMLDVSHNLLTVFPNVGTGCSLLSVSVYGNPLDKGLEQILGTHGFRRGIPMYYEALRKAGLCAAGRNLVRLEHSLGGTDMSADCVSMVGSYLTGERGNLAAQMFGLRKAFVSHISV